MVAVSLKKKTLVGLDGGSLHVFDEPHLFFVPVLAFGVAVPLQAAEPQVLPDTTGLEQYVLVDLNTADLSALCTLPGVGEKRAQTILDYRTQNGPFERVEDAANVPGLTQTIVDSWAGLATVS